MAKRSNVIFVLIMVGAFTLLIIASGAGPLLVQILSAIGQALFSVFMALVSAIRALITRR